jgi:uncharacterized repeat protein (TIGR03803 family)
MNRLVVYRWIPGKGELMTTTERLLGLVGMLGALSIAPVHAQTEVVLHSFSERTGENPYAGVIRDAAGNLYGTSEYGGPSRRGVVYKLSRTGHYKVLHGFTSGADGDRPIGGVTRDSAGNLYGTTYTGGAANAGAVYKVNMAGHETVLYSFTGGSDGANPIAGVIRDSAGNLYGTTALGGAAFNGVVFKLDMAGQETVLYSFTGEADGGQPYAGVIQDATGNLYGTTYQGGLGNHGVVYKLDVTGQETVLYSFTGEPDGDQPHGGVALDPAGNLYGTTFLGGTSDQGAVYKLDATGRESILYSFTGGSDGGNPADGVVRTPNGDLYATASGYTSGHGVVFELNSAGDYTILYSFTGANDGGNPLAGVIRDSKGDLYGTTSGGGKHNRGTIFEIKP